MEYKEKIGYTEEGFITAADKAYGIISKKILSGEFEPGCKLSRRKMAEVTGVSVIPVIEALNRLEGDGLVESKPQWGSFVINPTLEKIKEIYILREAIECQVARVLSQKINAEEEQVLRSIAIKLDTCEYSEDTQGNITDSHYEFHMKMAEYTGYNSLVSSLKRINLFWVLCKAISTRREKSPMPKDWHKRVVDGIMTGDPDKAEAIMRIHVADSLHAIGVKLGEGRNI
jgi:DNA-binding GntR family transcriptional regulator